MTIPPVEGTFGHAVPPYPKHAITTHVPTWQAMLDFIDRKPDIMGALKSMYPRMMVHPEIKELTTRICHFAKVPETQTCLLYPTLVDAESQVEFTADPKRGDLQLKKADINIRAFDIDVRYYAVFFEKPNLPKLMPFWSNAGIGVTSRRAEESLKDITKLREVEIDSVPPANPNTVTEKTLQRRIADLLERAPVGGPHDKKVQPNDVYFFQSGMAAIYWTNHYLTHSVRSGTTTMYGYAFHSTPHTLEDFSKAWKLFGRGAEAELDELERWLGGEKQAGRPVQTLFAEFPANPMLTTPDLARLRKLADTYGFVLIIDDTVGSFSNVDIMGPNGADIVISSLSKSFSGYADLLMGSAILNPVSPIYAELKSLFDSVYSNDVCPSDLDALERNSRNYLERSTILNHNAEVLVDFLQSKADDPNSSVSAVMHPSVHPQRANYEARMRDATEEFTPGFGCLFSVQFEDVPATIAFYDEVGKYLHIGPHLGAHKTLLLAYVKALYGKELDKAKEYGLDERAIRVSVGFEDTPERLLEIFKVGVEAADQLKGHMSGEAQAPDMVTTIN